MCACNEAQQRALGCQDWDKATILGSEVIRDLGGQFLRV